tara:strand:- start:3517 stop:4383 length:867 start_codon:yes stop_codon:yes gene_type:complete
MAYYQSISKPTAPNSLGLNFDAYRVYVEVKFSGYTSSSPYDVIKIQTQNEDSNAWVDIYSATLTSAAGDIKAIVNLDRKTAKLRAKGYDSDGTTALSLATGFEHPVIFTAKAQKNKSIKGVDYIGTEAASILKNIIEDDPVPIDEKKGFHEGFKRAMKAAYSAINSNDGTDMTEITITSANENSNGLNQLNPQIKNGVVKGKNWCINGTNLPTPFWVIDDKVYTFKETNSDGGTAIAKKCEEVLVPKLSKEVAYIVRKNYASSTPNYNTLTSAVTTLDSLATEKIGLI